MSKGKTAAANEFEAEAARHCLYPSNFGVGSHVKPDGWAIGNRLTAGVEGFSDYCLPTNSLGPVRRIAVNVEITGRVPQRIGGELFFRVRITAVGDGEPDSVFGGWTPAFWG